MKIHITTGSGLEAVLEKTGRSLSDRFGIRVVCRGNECATNGRTIFLPSLPDEMPPEMLQVIRGYLDHETGHLLGKSNFRIFKWLRDKYGPQASLFLNILEDLRIEEVMRQRFPGSRRNLAAAHSYLVGEAIKSPDPMPVWRQLAFGVHTRGNKQPDLPFVGPEVRQVLDMISDAVLKAPRCRNTKGVTRLAEEAWPIVSQLFPPPPPASSASADAPDPDQSQSGQGTASGGPGGAAQNPDHADSACDVKIGDDDHDPADTNTQTRKTQTIQQDAGESGGNAQDNTVAADIMRTLADAIVDMVNDYSQANRAYRIWTTELDTVETAWNNTSIPHHQRMAKLLPHVAGVRQKLLQTLLAEPKARWLGDKEIGRINPRALHRLVAPQPDNSGNDRVFRDRVRIKRLHTAVTLLVDQSGSMDRDKIRLAGDTALVFCEALSRLDIPSCVVGFSTGDYEYYSEETEAKTGMTLEQLVSTFRIAPLRHTYFKRFNESFRAVSGRFDSMGSRSLTPLGESILFAARELAARREERRVLFVITDGSPGVGLDDDSATFEHAKTSIKRVERAGIDVALVGIMSRCVDKLHHRSVDIDSIDELPKTVMRQLHSLLVNHSAGQYGKPY